jgi:four helix bundle protein
MPTPTFDHDRLDVYQLSLEFIERAHDLVRKLPAGSSYLVDQLQRAATSITLNIAEGAGEFSRKDKARFYRMASRSATECAALIDVCGRAKLLGPEGREQSRLLLWRIVSMLTRLSQHLTQQQSKRPGMGTGTGTETGLGRAVHR